MNNYEFDLCGAVLAKLKERNSYMRRIRQDIAKILRDRIAVWADLTDCCQVHTNLIPPTTIACSKCGAIVKDG